MPVQRLTVSPSPMHGEAAIRYVLPRAARVTLAVHDVRGRRVAILAEGMEEAGAHTVSWAGCDAGGAAVVPGVYWVRLMSGGDTVTQKVIRE